MAARKTKNAQKEKIQKLEKELEALRGQLSKSPSPKRGLLTPFAILTAGVIIAMAIFYSRGLFGKKTTTSGAQTPPTAPPVDIKQVNLEGEPFIGSPDAPLVMAYWLDFQCPFCKRFDTQTLPVIVEKYVKSGKLKIVFKDYQFLGPDSQTAGLIAKAIWELYPQDYFAWHQKMFEKQDAENAGFGSQQDILQMIKKEFPQMDINRIQKLVAQKKDEYQKEQDQDKLEGTRFGISGTPALIIGKQKIIGAQPTQLFLQIIEDELNKAQK